MAKKKTATSTGIPSSVKPITATPAPGVGVREMNVDSEKKEWAYGLLWNGFYYEWNAHPHRLSILGTRFSNIDFGRNNLSADHAFSLKIGAFPKDDGDYNIPYRTFRSKNIFIGYGASQPIPISSDINSSARRTTSQAVRLKDLHSSSHIDEIKNSDNVVVALNGFKITNSKSFDFTAGWHFGGLGIEIENTRIENGKVKFDIKTFIQPSESADILTQADSLFGKWDSDNPCQYDIEVDFIVIAGASDRLNVVTREYTTSEESTIFHESEFYMPLLPSPNPLRLIAGKGDDAYPKAFPAILGFFVDIESAKNIVKKNGRYIRSFGINVKDFTYNAQSGIAEIGLHVRFANGKSNKKQAWKSSAKFDIETSVNAALIQVNGCSDVIKRLVADTTSKEHNDQRIGIDVSW